VKCCAVQDNKGETVFHWATRSGFTALMKQLADHVEKHAKTSSARRSAPGQTLKSQLINASNHEGHSPLVISVLAEQIEAFRSVALIPRTCLQKSHLIS
jgi:hypothetical protein